MTEGGQRVWVFGNELMTPYTLAVNGSTAPLSVVSVGQFEDIGHIVNYAAADPYVLPETADAAADGEVNAEDSNSQSPRSFSLANDVKPVDIEVVGRRPDGQAVVERVIKAHEMYPKEVLEAWGVRERGWRPTQCLGVETHYGIRFNAMTLGGVIYKKNGAVVDKSRQFPRERAARGVYSTNTFVRRKCKRWHWFPSSLINTCLHSFARFNDGLGVVRWLCARYVLHK